MSETAIPAIETVAPEAPPAEVPAVEVQSTGFDSLPEWAQKEIRNLRGGEAKYRSERNSVSAERDQVKNTLDAIMKTLNPDKQDDPADLAKALTEKDHQILKGSIELAVLRSASKLGADPEGLLDSNSFMKKALGLDVASENFAADLESAVKEAIESNSRLKGHKKAPAAAASVAEFTGGTGGTKTYTRSSIKNMTPEEYRANAVEIRKALAEGRIQ